MKSALVLLAGFLFTPAALAQTSGRVDWGNTSTTLIYTNSCSGTIGPVSGPNAYRFGLYVGPLGTPAGLLTLVDLATNAPIAGRLFPPSPQLLPPQFPAGTPLSFQVRGWSWWAGFSYEDALFNPSPGVLFGKSDVGYVTPIVSGLPPRIFGTGPGQISGLELMSDFCREVSIHRIAPDGPVQIIRTLPNFELTWSNVTDTAIYVVQAATSITGPWTNLATVSSTNFQTTYTLPVSADGLHFYTVTWTNAPPPEPVGGWGWDYQAFDKSGAVMAAGMFNFVSNVPSSVSFTFSRIQTLAQNSVVALHPQGPGSMTAYSVGAANTIELFFSSEFRLRGQMVPSSSYGDYYAGDWFATDYIINPPPGTSPFIIHSGRFVALRHYQF